MADEILLNEVEVAVAKELNSSAKLDVGEFANRIGVDQSQVSAAVTMFSEQGNVQIVDVPRDELVISAKAAELLNDGLPERKAAAKLIEAGGELTMPDFVVWAKSANVAVNEVIKWGGARGWIERAKGNGTAKIVLTQEGKDALSKPDDDERALDIARKGQRVFLDELSTQGIDAQRVQRLLGNRPELAKIKPRTQRIGRLAGNAKITIKASGDLRALKSSLTPEDLESGAWRQIDLRPYDVTLAAREIYPAKIHPLRKIIEQTRRAFLEMGFAEVASPMIESAFWNFDALFQPQDHPARDMQDTFYMRDPAEAPLPDSKIVEPVRRTHEDGWETGSEGWGYTWSPERSKQVVLRTHTTAATIRALAANPNPPGKFFCVGWTYRNETISFKHLPVFHQVDGIIVDEEANLASLMGTLQEFYSKMGFGRVKFKPAFYPYTEPSVDVVVYMESRRKWLEMGGAGIFRPEVTLPLGCRWPVLAWGLGIERLAMLRFGLDDIRELYRPSLDVLEGVPLCR